MEWGEILAILIFVGVLTAVGLLAVLLVRVRRAGGLSDRDRAALTEQIVRELTADLGDLLRREVNEPILRAEREGQSALRGELGTEIRATRTELTNAVQTSVERLGQSLRETQRGTAELQDKRIEAMQTALNTLLSERLDALNAMVDRRLGEVETRFRELREQSERAQAELRRTVEEKLTAMQSHNEKQLSEMRATVDEKLQKTLDERISQSFKMVNDRLGEVYRGLGEMQALAGDVGDLKKVMSGVKTRGIFGEIRLGAIMEEILTPEQYLENAVTRPGTANRVEFAVKLPGEGEEPVLLPIDAKFPADAYHHVVDAYESGDPDRIKAATTELEARIKGCAKDIRDKYLEPPYTTTFGILFLPFEGLYAEVVRMGLVDVLQQTYRVSIAGPTTLSALLNSLQMGFRTLAIQKRSGEVWEVLGAVKTEFGNFEKVLAKAKERIDQTGNELDKLIGARTKKINLKLRSVSALPAEDAGKLLDTTDVISDPSDEPDA